MTLLQSMCRLDDFRTLPSSEVQEVPPLPSEYRDALLSINGGIAYGGAIRVFPAYRVPQLPTIGDWNDPPLWKNSYGSLIRSDLTVFCEDAFGVQFAIGTDGLVTRIWNETAEAECLGMRFQEFFNVIHNDPVGTISLDLYQSAEQSLGPLPLSEHFAFKIETALGGKAAVENVMRMGSVMHMRACGGIARQIKSMPIGTKVTIR